MENIIIEYHNHQEYRYYYSNTEYYSEWNILFVGFDHVGVGSGWIVDLEWG